MKLPDNNFPRKYETERMTLQLPTLADFPAVYEILRNPNIMRFVTTGARSEAEAKKELEGWINHWENHGFGSYLAFDKNRKLVGFAKLYTSERSPFVQIGYAVNQKFWGKGLGTELATACLELGFKYLEEPRLVAFARCKNHASRRILEKVGMRCETDSLIIDGRDYSYYSIDAVKYWVQQYLQVS